MTPESIMDLAHSTLMVTALLSAPLLLVALVAGLIIGILQAATQINEPSISFVVKVISVVGVIVGLGPTLASHAVDYTRSSLGSIETVVHR